MEIDSLSILRSILAEIEYSVLAVECLMKLLEVRNGDPIRNIGRIEQPLEHSL